MKDKTFRWYDESILRYYAHYVSSHKTVLNAWQRFVHPARCHAERCKRFGFLAISTKHLIKRIFKERRINSNSKHTFNRRLFCPLVALQDKLQLSVRKFEVVMSWTPVLRRQITLNASQWTTTTYALKNGYNTCIELFLKIISFLFSTIRALIFHCSENESS